MRGILCCTWFDRCLCFWASRKRKPLIAIQLALQGLVLVLLVVQLGLGSADSYEVVAGAPTFSLEWRFDDFAKDLWGVSRAFNAWDGTVHFNLNRVAFETNLTNNPKICRTRPEICLNSEPDGSLRRFSWPLGEFIEVVQREIDEYASRLLDGDPRLFPFGSAPTDAPWYFDLAVNSEGHACSEINEYEYSYGSASGMFDCNRVWDPDGSVHGNARSYGPYEGMTISISIMLNDDGNSWRLCDTPEASIWGNSGDDFSECYDESTCTSPDMKGGTDCLVGPDEACGCMRGYPKTTGKHILGGMSVYKCCPGHETASGESASGESEATCGNKRVTSTPGVCYWVSNRSLTGATYNAISEPLYDCEVHSARAHGLMIGMILLATARILLQVVWYRRCNAKLDFGKKGLNLWLVVIPLVATGAIVQYYWKECVEHMGIYSLIREELAGNWSYISNPENFRSLADKQPAPRAGTIVYSFNMLTLLCYVVVLVIEFIIPADKYAERLEAPPAPPAPPSLPAPSEPDPTVGPNTDPQLSATRDAALKRGGLLQSFGITMGGVQNDLVDMATFLEAGTLHVSATGLKSADLNGKSDPYVRLTLAGQQAKSKTIMKSLDPQWDETFEFVGVRGELLKHKLHLNVFDWDRFSMDDKLGFACLNLEPMLHTLEHAEKIELSEQGSVSLRLRWVPQTQEQALSAATNAGGALPVIQAQQPQKVTGKLCVHLLRGEGLKVANKNGLSDPFVKLSLGKKTHTSKTIKGTVDPRWNSKFEFQCTQDALDTSPLKLSVFDWDPIYALNRNESLGYASIDLSPLLTSTSFWSLKKQYTVELQKTKDGPSAKTERGREEATGLGRLHLNVSWEGDDDYQLGMGMGSLLGPIFAASTKLLHAAAKCIVNPLQEDPIVVPAHHHGKAWAARQYFMSTYSGPREGECSERPVPLGWLDQMMEDGHLPRDLKVWRVDGGKAWVSLGQEIKTEIKAEIKTEKNIQAAEASTGV